MGLVRAGFVAVLFVFSVGCMDQYNPRPYWNQFNQERALTSHTKAKLNADGTIPEKAAAVVDADPIMAKYSALCSSCHGVDGKADSAAAAAMVPKPRNLHDKAWQAKVDDAHIVKVLKEGGTAVGLAATMPAWGAVLTEEEIQGLVVIIRNWGK